MFLRSATVFSLFSAALLGFAQQHYPITGVPTGGPQAPLRRNINDLAAKGGPQWDLYVQALQGLYAAKDDDPLSFFQIAGIHGRPFMEWNKTGTGVNGGWGGYCPHGESLFLSWHRAYLLLFEQALVGQAKKIASTYPPSHRPQYEQAATTLRSPYWDWAYDSNVPPVTAQQQVRITGSDLRQKLVDNPLWTFTFSQAVLGGKYGSLDANRRPRTYRCQAPESYPASANARLGRNSYRKWAHTVLTRPRSFTEFTLSSAELVSLEQIHNNIHIDAACGQQFSSLELAAFEPLFMLHHTNIDRIWAYWQIMRPEHANLDTAYQAQARFSVAAGTSIDSASPLPPFFNKEGAFHTSLSMRQIWDFGYSYEGLEWWEKNIEYMKGNVTRLVNQKYSPPMFRAMPMSSDAGPERRATVRIELDRAQIERPSKVEVFVLGELAGSLAILNHPSQGIVRAGFALDDVALPETLNNFLDNPKNSTIQVRIVKAKDNSIIPLEGVPSLKAQLEVVNVTNPSTETEVPLFSKPALLAQPRVLEKAGEN